MKFTALDWKRLSGLLDRAMDLQPEQRKPWVDSLDDSHADLRAPLSEILFGGEGRETDDFMRALPQFSTVSGSGSLAATEVAAGDVVGAYRLVRELGAGGTASVWLAERADGTLQRQFALKFPHVGHVDRGLAERLARERDILTSLDHPNIARLYDAGLDDKGRPYLALEFVDGISPDEYCRRHACSPRQRLELFLQVARAVAYAHGRLVVHRDLKPNNILVTDAGEVRLLDFGIARLLEGDRAAAAFQTQVGARALTPAYAAPEQFLGQPVTVASDVYSLGVVLFELLTGRSPYSPARPTLSGIERAVLEDEAPLASASAPPAHARALRGDLDTILRKALAKLPQERYSSVEAFAADVERHLADIPIHARPRSAWYVARKFIRRNGWAVAGAGLAAAAVVAALGVALAQWRAADHQREMALLRLRDAHAASDFATAVLTERVGSDEKISSAELLARSEALATDAGGQDIRTRIVASLMVASWYRSFGQNEHSYKLLTRTLASVPANERALTVRLLCARAQSYAQVGQSADEGIAEITGAIAMAQDEVDIANCLGLRSSIAANNGDGARALEDAVGALRTYEKAGAPIPAEEVSFLVMVAVAYRYDNQTEAGLLQLNRAYEILKDAGREQSANMVDVFNLRGSAYAYAGIPLRALPEMERAYELGRRLSPNEENWDIPQAVRAGLLDPVGRYEESEQLFSEAAATAARRNNRFSIVYAGIGRANLALTRGQIDLARQYLSEVEATLNPKTAVTLRIAFNRAQGRLLAAEGRMPEARARLSESIDAAAQAGCCEGQLSQTLTWRGEVALRERRIDDAQRDADRALELARAVQGNQPGSFYVGQALVLQARLSAERGHHPPAAQLYATAARQFALAVGERSPAALAAQASAVAEHTAGGTRD